MLEKDLAVNLNSEQYDSCREHARRLLKTLDYYEKLENKELMNQGKNESTKTERIYKEKSINIKLKIYECE